MNILVDENIPKRTVDSLRKSGHDVKDIRGTKLEGITDSELIKIALEENRILISTDKWFAGTPDNHLGIIIITLKQPNAQKIHDRVLMALEQFDESDWCNLILIMRDNVQSIRRKH